jgi:NADPH:quinone reductase-like Zn-dependent oxidoreductase
MRRLPAPCLVPSPIVLAAHVARLDGATPVDNLAVGDRPDPVVRPGWSIVRVEAASVNHHDLWTLRGRSSQPVQVGQVLGCDAAGVVVEHGEGGPPDAPAPGTPVVVHSVVGCGECAACRSGDELLCGRMALLSEGDLGGTLAELVAVPTANLIPRPPTLDAVDAACLPTAYLTAYRMLFTRAALRPGQSVLVQGASGGVATAAILLARAAGITVLATSRDAAKRDLAVELGAAAALAPDREAAAEIKRLTGGDGVDAVIETVGEPTWQLSLRALRPGGSIVVAGATAGDASPAGLTRIYWFHLSILGSTMGTFGELTRLVALAASGAFKPLVDEVLPLERAPEAFERMAAGEQRGKLVLRP